MKVPSAAAQHRWLFIFVVIILGGATSNRHLLRAAAAEDPPKIESAGRNDKASVPSLIISSSRSSGTRTLTSESRRLVIGTPTGGGKYPFLSVLGWDSATTDPRAPGTAVWYHGVMIAADVLLTSSFCSLLLPYFGLEPHPEMRHFLFRTEPVTFDGFVPAVLNADSGAVLLGQYVTVAGYGSSDLRDSPASFPGTVTEATLRVAAVSETSFALDRGSGEVGPCRGDIGAPVLDSNGTLVGLIDRDACDGNSTAVRISHVKDWIEETSCAMSQAKESMWYCQALLVCPADLRLLGYPFVELPNGTASAAAIHGYAPVRIWQFPPPGTPLWRNTTTNVTISAVDSENRTLECTWSVSVAPLVQLGTVNLTLPRRPNGTFQRRARFRGNPDVLSGIIYKMSGALQDKLHGSGSKVSVRLRSGSNKQTGALTLEQGETKALIRVPNVPIKYATYTTSDVQVNVTGRRTRRRNHVSYKVFGQVELFRP